MSVNTKLIAASAIGGAHKVVAQAKDYLARAIAAKGADAAVAFPDTNYGLPVIYSMLGEKVSKLSDLQSVIAECDRLLPAVPSEKIWLPYLGDTLDAGMATLFAFEIIEACKYLIGPNPVNGIWLGAAIRRHHSRARHRVRRRLGSRFRRGGRRRSNQGRRRPHCP